MNKRENHAKECFVAFIDILGFKEMIDEDKGEGKNLQIIQDAIYCATKLLKERKGEVKGKFHFWFDEFKVKSFSDCFCFSVPLEFDNGQKDYEQNFVAFYTWLMVFYNELLNKGFLCRGGITQGWHYVDDDIIFSKALVEAYLLESKLATHPMVMVSETLLENFKSQVYGHRDYIEYLFTHDISGRHFLNPLNYAIVDEIYFGFESQRKELIEREKETRGILAEKYLDIINSKIKSLRNRGAADKYQWLRELIKFTTQKEYSDKFMLGLNN